MKVRRLTVTAVLLGSMGALAGCNTSTLSKQELVVTFYPGAPQSDHVNALKACGNISPDTKPEPMTTSTLPSDAVGNVRFRTDHADDNELAHLEECLNKQPGVRGVDTPDMTG